MNLRLLLQNFSVAVIAQGVNLLVSCLLSLFVPKVLGVEEYGYWQLFIFYSSYVGLFHFGLNDGVYLLFGGNIRSDINKETIKAQFIVGLTIQCVIAVAIVTIASFFCSVEQRTFVWISVAVFLLLNNSAAFLGYILQAMNETKSYSFSVLINGISFLVPLAVLLCLGIKTFELYVVWYLVAKAISLSFCILKCHDIVTSTSLRPSTAIKETVVSMKVGIKLTVANLLNLSIIGIVQFLVDLEWDVETFGLVSLSLSLVTFFMVFISQVSMVLFPTLRQSEKDEQVSFFEKARDLLGLFLPAVFLLYQPINWILSLWLPQYSYSFELFCLLLPLCVFDGKMDIVGSTYLKVLRGEGTLLRINCCTALISIIGACLGAFVFRSVEIMIVFAVLSIVGRCLYSERYVALELGASLNMITIHGVLLSIVFIFASTFIGGLVSFLFFFVLYCVFLLVNYKTFKKTVSAFFKAMKQSGA